MGSSISCGLKKLLELYSDIGGCIITVCDQPYMEAAVLFKLVEKQKETGKGIIASSYAATIGTPVLFQRKYFRALMELSATGGAQKMIKKYAEDVDSIAFDKGAIDIDTVADYEQLINPI